MSYTSLYDVLVARHEPGKVGNRMFLRLRIYAVASVFVIVSRWCNSLADAELRQLIGTLLVVSSVVVLEWTVRTIWHAAARHTKRHLLRTLSGELMSPHRDDRGIQATARSSLNPPTH